MEVALWGGRWIRRSSGDPSPSRINVLKLSAFTWDGLKEAAGAALGAGRCRRSQGRRPRPAELWHGGDQSGQETREAEQGAGGEEDAEGTAPRAQEGPVLPPGSPVEPAVPWVVWGTGPGVGRGGGTHTGTSTSTLARSAATRPPQGRGSHQLLLPPAPPAGIHPSSPRLPEPGGMLGLGRGRRN